MEPDVRASGALFAAGVVTLVLLHRYIYMPASLALFRQDLFTVRRRLFLLGAEGQIPFDHPAYTHLRMTMNGLLRFAERATLSRIALTMWMARSHLDFGATDRLIGAIDDADLRQSLDEVRTDIGMAIFFHLVRTSPVMWFLVLIGTSLYMAKIATTLMHGRWREIKRGIGERLGHVAEALTSDPYQGPRGTAGGTV